jgi:glutamyl-tRNA reductase
MTELAARHLVAQGVSSLTIANRTYARAATLARRCRAFALPWDEVPQALERVDIVLTGYGGTATPVLTRETVRRRARARRGRPLLLVDIAVPRDVEPETNTLEGVYLYDVDDLQDDRGRRSRREDARARKRRGASSRSRSSRSTAGGRSPTWRPDHPALRERLHAMGREEIARFGRRLGPLGDAERATVEELLRSLVQKILHRPTITLKAAADRGEAARLRGALPRDLRLDSRAGRGRGGRAVAGHPRREGRLSVRAAHSARGASALALWQARHAGGAPEPPLIPVSTSSSSS